MKRKLPHWLDAYREYTSPHEAPPLIHFWTGISMVAATLERRVWLDRGFWTTYPNLYVIIVSPSGVARKTTSANIGTELVEMLDPPISIMAERLTTAGLISHMGKSESHFRVGEMGYIHTSAFAIAPELSILLGEIPGGGGSLIDLLTRFHDCKMGTWDYEKAKMKTEVINPCLNIYGGTTPMDLIRLMPGGAMSSGFTARIIFVVQMEADAPVALPERILKDEKYPLLKASLVHDLHIIRSLSGEMRRTKAANNFYQQWYDHTHYAKPVIEDERFEGYISRRTELVWRLAMIASIMQNSELVVETKHVREAIGWLEIVEITMPQAFGPFGRSVDAQDTAKAYKLIQAAGKVRHSVLLRKMWRNVSGPQLEMIARSLEAMQMIDITHEGERSATVYNVKDVEGELV